MQCNSEMKIIGLQFRLLNSLAIFASKIKKRFKNIINFLSNPIESIQYMFLNWIGPLIDYRILQKTQHLNDHLYSQKQGYDYSLMKVMMKSFIKYQSKHYGQIDKKNMEKKIDGMSYDQLKIMYDTVEDIHRSSKSLSTQEPSSECIQESKFLQKIADKTETDK